MRTTRPTTQRCTTLYNASNARADLTGSMVSTNFAYGRPDGTVGSVDDAYFAVLYVAAESLSRGVLSGSASSDSLRNRKGLAGYEWDPSTSKYHVRNRVLDPETGRWTRRNPLGYVEGASLYQYVSSAAMLMTDPTGLPGGVPGAVAQSTWPPSVPPRDQECCDRAVDEGLDDGSWGGVICCGRRKVACSWYPLNPLDCDGTTAGCDRANELIDYCIRVHEQFHKDDVSCDDPECQGLDVCRPPFLPGRDPDTEECSSNCKELSCLWGIRTHCNDLPTQADIDSCNEQIEDLAGGTCDNIDGYCGQGNPPSSCRRAYQEFCQ